MNIIKLNIRVITNNYTNYKLSTFVNCSFLYTICNSSLLFVFIFGHRRNKTRIYFCITGD